MGAYSFSLCITVLVVAATASAAGECSCASSKVKQSGRCSSSSFFVMPGCNEAALMPDAGHLPACRLSAPCHPRFLASTCTWKIQEMIEEAL